MPDDKVISLQDVKGQRLGEQYLADLERLDGYAGQITLLKDISFYPACSSDPTKGEMTVTIVVCEGAIGARVPVNGFRIKREDWEKLRDMCDRMFVALASS